MKTTSRPLVKNYPEKKDNNGGFSWWVLAPFGIALGTLFFVLSGDIDPWTSYITRIVLLNIALFVLTRIAISEFYVVKRIIFAKKFVRSILSLEGLIILFYLFAVSFIGFYWTKYMMDLPRFVTSNYAVTTDFVHDVYYQKRRGGTRSLQISHYRFKVGNQTLKSQKSYDIEYFDHVTIIYLPHSKFVLDIVRNDH